MKVPEIIKGLYKPPFVYDKYGQMIFDANSMHVLDIRGWGKNTVSANGGA